MIIDSNSNSVNSSTASSSRTRQPQQVAENRAEKQPARTEEASSDSVSLSSKAQTMGRLEARIAETPDVDEAKVEAVKAAIAEGRYQVDSETIADRMLKQDSLLTR